MQQRARSVARDDTPAARGVDWLRPALLVRAGWAVGGLVLFALALEVTRAGAGSLAPLLADINVEGVTNGLGFGWLFAYIVLSGSPVAAIGVTLLSEGVFLEAEAFAVIAGSREHIIPYVLGANIATFVDTLAASVLVVGDAAVAVVLAQMASISVVAGIVPTVVYRPYRAGILRSERWIAARPPAFLGIIVAVPVALLVV